MNSSDQNEFLAALALAMVERPRASLQELAKAVGVSKATLYRFSRTRESLIELLTEHSANVLVEVTLAAKSESLSPLEALREMTARYMEHRELSSFLLYYWRDEAMNSKVLAEWHAQIDAFFLRGQQAGVFRIDIPAAALTKVWTFVLIGLVNGERDGRIARASLATIAEQVFLEGIATKSK